MKAVWYEQNGPAAQVLRIGEIPMDDPGTGEVQIKLHSSGVNPTDVKSRAGTNRKLAFPHQIPDSDGAGVVEVAGPEVSEFAVGDKVWMYNGAFARPHGTAAEFITLPTTQVAPLPPGLDYAQGACLGIPCMTAHRCLFADGPIEQQWVLVSGGSGVVGHYAVQMAKWAGARVIATAGSPDKQAHVRDVGIDHVLSYRDPDLVERVIEITGGRGVDRVVEVELANLEQDLAMLKAYGTVVAYGMAGPNVLFPPVLPLMVKNPLLRMVLMYTMPDKAKTQAVVDIARWCAEGAPQFTIAKHFTLDDAVAAHEFVEEGAKTGHVILDIT